MQAESYGGGGPDAEIMPDYEISASGSPPPQLLACILNLKMASI